MLFVSCLITLFLSHVQENILLCFCLKALLTCLSHLDLHMCVYGVRGPLVFLYVHIDQLTQHHWWRRIPFTQVRFSLALYFFQTLTLITILWVLHVPPYLSVAHSESGKHPWGRAGPKRAYLLGFPSSLSSGSVILNFTFSSLMLLNWRFHIVFNF